MLSAHKLDISWRQVDIAVLKLHQRMILHGFRPKRILAVARGGLTPAVMLAHLFNVHEIGMIHLCSYGSSRLRSELTVQSFDPAGYEFFNKPDTLIVDDLWDSGKTHEWLKDKFPEAVTCTAFFKDRNDNAHRVVSFPGTSIPPGYWAIFPWELAPEGA